MNQSIYCSTGTIVGRENQFDYRIILQYAPEIAADGFELMMLRCWYGYLPEIARILKRSRLHFPVIHSDKDIGTLISLGGEANLSEANRLYDENCRMGEAIGAEKIVLHLWGGPGSDAEIERNLAMCDSLRRTAAGYGMSLVIENVPCTKKEPLGYWQRLREMSDDIRFLFDTRFGAFHGQLDEIFNRPFFAEKRILHMHVSDFVGPAGDFTKLRPIPQPGQGIIDFKTFFARLTSVYHESITLESPAIFPDGRVDSETLNQSIEYIRRSMNQ